MLPADGPKRRALIPEYILPAPASTKWPERGPDYEFPDESRFARTEQSTRLSPEFRLSHGLVGATDQLGCCRGPSRTRSPANLDSQFADARRHAPSERRVGLSNRPVRNPWPGRFSRGSVSSPIEGIGLQRACARGSAANRRVSPGSVPFGLGGKIRVRRVQFLAHPPAGSTLEFGPVPSSSPFDLAFSVTL